jgi:nitroreductase
MQRTSDYPIERLLLERWSPRAMAGQPISDEELMTLFEAARWAPSSYNGQPWRFIYAKRDTKHWAKLFDLLVPFNQSWCHAAAVLVVIVSRDTFAWNNKPARTHSFDTGAAWENLALQGHAMGLVVHGMEGFDYERAKKELNIPDGYTVEAMFAVGRPGRKEDLHKELQEREEMSNRNPISSFVFEGEFKAT